MASRSPSTFVALRGFVSGRNGYANPRALPWTAWADSADVYGGLHGTVRRIRRASVVAGGITPGFGAQPTGFNSIFYFEDPSPQRVLLGDVNNLMFAFNVDNSYSATARTNPYGKSGSALAGPWSRVTMFNRVFEHNGIAKFASRGSLLTTLENHGLDTPDSSPAVTLSGGAITKTVGRSYRWAWENEAIPHVSAPSPATAFIAYASQQGQIDLVQPGTININGNTVTGIGTAFTAAWIGRRIWVESLGGNSDAFRIVSVASETSMTLAGAPGNVTGKVFQVFDVQATHIRLYATGDGGSIYFRIARNAFDKSQTTLAAAGLQFIDNSNAEPPNAPFTDEQAEFFNVPPPVGGALKQAQSRLLVYRVPGAMQTLFYSNLEFTSVGSPPDSFAPLNQITFPIGSAELGLVLETQTGIVVWSNERDMFKINGLLSDNSVATGVQLGASIQRLPYALGAAGQFAGTETPLGLVWLTSDREVYIYNEQFPPRNIGRPIQDLLNRINPARLHDARMVFYTMRDRSWVVLGVALDSSTVNNTLLVLDIAQLVNGAAGGFAYDFVQSQPAWYVLLSGGSALAVSDTRLLTGSSDTILDADYDGVQFKIGELPTFGFVELHAFGNDSPESIKRLKWVRLVTNQAPTTSGWAITVKAIDDDVFTFDSPQTTTLTPGTDSPSVGRAFIESPFLFRLGGVKFVQGRRLRFRVDFPSDFGDLELHELQLGLRILRPR